MFSKVKKILLTTTLVTTITAVPAFADKAFVGTLSELSYTSQCEEYAEEGFQNRGIASLVYTNFTRNNFINNVPIVTCVYIDSHGGRQGTEELRVITSSGGDVTSMDADFYSKGYYKFVFMDTCHSADTNAWYRAFHMKGNNGGLMLGWKAVADQTLTCYYTYFLFNKLGSGSNYGSAMYNAYLETKVSNYGYFGDANGTL